VKSPDPLDCLIVGQGLAGSLLGWTLMQRGQRIGIIDPGQNNASRVAAGLINPVTGFRLVKATNTEKQLQAAKQLYRQLEQQFKWSFLIEKPMLRLLSSDKDRQQAKKRLTDPDYAEFLPGIIPSHPDIRSPAGLLKQAQTGYLKTVELLDCLRAFFIEHQCLIKSHFDHTELRLTPTLRWRDLTLRRIIFCQGHESLNNPWFGYLPLKPVKGEILTLQSHHPLLNEILNYGHWLLPLTSGLFKTGASFDRENINLQPTTKAKQSLLSALSRVYPALDSSQLIDHQVGIRPATSDRQPLIGSHPEQPKLYIFNGFGAKGSLQIPYYAHQLTCHLMQGQPLPAECDISRYA
jgi:glycine/D-amino acid oxidase-like deaminating enzyme